MVNKIDSNATGLAYAEEESLKVLPGTPVWYELEPNTYSDLGGELSMVARDFINPSRQRKKGTITDLDASGGFNSDVTESNMIRLLQGFFFADAREKFSTQSLNDTAIPITGVVAATDDYQAASGLNGALVGSLIKASNFTEVANNGLKTATVIAAGAITVSESLVDEASPPADSKLETVGFQFPSGDLDINEDTTFVKLESTLTDFTTLGLNIGEFIGIGGDSAAFRFVNTEPGYGRIKAITTDTLTLDDTTFTATDETGTGLTIQIFFGTVIRNEKSPALIVRRSYNIERQLGDDGNGTQSEYLEGAIANEFTLNIPQADKLNADLTFVAMDSTQRDGTTGVKTGTRVTADGEDPFNTSSDVFRIKLSVVDPASMNPTALFGYVSEANVTINNNVTPNKAVAYLGAFDASAGNFEIGGSLTAYFSEVAAIQAIRNNSDVALNFIAAKDNAGFVFDIPLLSLGGGRLNVEKDAPITIPLEPSGAECAEGYTLLSTFFQYLPDSVMPTQ